MRTMTILIAVAILALTACTRPEDDKGCDHINTAQLNFCQYLKKVKGKCVVRTRECNDGNPCTTDRCVKSVGSCVHQPKMCEDGDPATYDSCHPETGYCVHNRQRPASRAVLSDRIVHHNPCNDGNSLTMDRKIAGGKCTHDLHLDKLTMDQRKWLMPNMVQPCPRQQWVHITMMDDIVCGLIQKTSKPCGCKPRAEWHR